MAFLSKKGYDYDILISYSHIDNLNGWVADFHANLNMKMQMVSGQNNIFIWRDTEISGNEVFDQVIRKRLNTSGLFIACNSNAYKNRPYCRMELEYLHRTIQKATDPYGLLVNNKARIFNVLLYNIPPAEWPAQLAGRTGHRFYDRKLPRPLSSKAEEYDDELTVLASDLWNLLEDMYKKNTRKETVFFGKCPNSLGVYHDQLQQSLSAITLLKPDPIEQLPLIERQHIEKVKGILDEACSSIHLFDEVKTDDEMEERFSDTKQYCYIKQVEIALQTNKPQLVWLPKTLEKEKIGSPIQREFLSSLEQSNKKCLDIIPGTPPEMKRAVEKWLEKYIKHPPEEFTDYWLIDADNDDADNVDEITVELRQSQKEIFDYQSSDDLIEALKKVQHYILVINKFPFSSVERLSSIIRAIPQMPADSKLGIYLPTGGKQLNQGQVERLMHYKDNGFVIYDKAGYHIDDTITTMNEFITALS